MSRHTCVRIVSLISILLVGHTIAVAQTVQGDSLRGQGSYLRGLGWYNLSTAKANSINVDAAIRWKKDLRQGQLDRWDDYARQIQKTAAGKKLKLEEIKRQQLVRQYNLRINPSATDVECGDALNVLLYDLTDPDISQENWFDKNKETKLPEGMSVKDLVFRFTSLKGSSATSVALSQGVIALSRLAVAGDEWPTAIQGPEIKAERAAYEAAYARVRDQILAGQFDLKSVQAMDRSLEALSVKVKTAVPAERDYRTEAVKFVSDLRDSTRMFDAATVDYAREILNDTRDHDATTVAELVAFMMKYRLQFASAERSPEARVMYQPLFEALKRQHGAFGIEVSEVPDAPVQPELPAGAVAFQGKHYKVYTDLLTWHDAKQKCEDLGGHLAIISSKEEDNFVLSLARKEDLAEVYLGATDEQKEGRWIWVSGQTMTYSHWGPQQPSNHFGTEHYLTLRLQPKHNGCWNDLPDVFQEYKIGFVCQWD